jgi:hypothetical protein
MLMRSRALPTSLLLIASLAESRLVKKRLLLLALILLVLLSAFLMLPRKNVVPSLPAVFLGFTNSGGQPEALFAFSNPPPASLSLHSIRRITFPVDSAARDGGRFSWGRREEWGLIYAIGVDTTNEPLRVVFQFQQRAVGLRRLVEQIRELFGRMAHNEREFFSGSIFLLTNEVRSDAIAQ